LPVGDSSFSWGYLIAQEGSSPEQMRQYQTIAEDVLQHNDAVDMTFTMTGGGAFFPSNLGILLAFLKDPSQRPAAQVMGPDGKMTTVHHPSIVAVSNQMTVALMGRLKGVMGVFTPQPVLQISTGATARGTGQFAFALSGIDPKQVYSTATKLTAKLSEKQGTMFASIVSDMYLNTPSLRIVPMREKASMYNVNPTQIEATIRNAYSQNYVYLIKKSDDQYQVILEASDAARRNPEDLSLLYIPSETGALIPLSAVAKWEPVVGPQNVNHINQFTSVTINFNLVPGVPIGKATDYIEQSFNQVTTPAIRGSFQGEALTFRDTVKTLLILMVLAVFVMYVILGILYESYLHPITVLSSLPVALVGGLLTLLLFGEEASLYAFVGMFMLMGIVKKNGIMVVDFAIQRVAHGQSAEQAIHDASMDRFRPIMMTTLAALMGALPIALGWGEDGGTRRPLGLVIVGGLLVSQLITLYVTPVIYLYLELFQEKVLNRYRFFRATTVAHDAAFAPMLPSKVKAANGNGHEGEESLESEEVSHGASEN
jgi:HAE1 family hydrophobic/amphiphilic exporter-1